MKAATDNAEDLITSLTRSMNRARQDADHHRDHGDRRRRRGAARQRRVDSADYLSDTIEGRDADLFAAPQRPLSQEPTMTVTADDRRHARGPS